MVVAVIGSGGQLGQALQYVAPDHPEIQFHFYTSQEIDIAQIDSITSVWNQLKPDFCINAAAYTAVDKAESEPEKAQAINVDGIRNLAEVCKRFDTTLLHISTDFVFEGNKNSPYNENDATNPQGIYGATKRAGELEIINTIDRYFIIRTSWLYSQFGNNFMKTMLRLSTEKEMISVVNDQIGTPTHAVDLAQMLITIVKSQSTNYGIYHYSNEGSISWYDFAKKIFELNHATIQLRPIPTSEYPTPAKRPRYSVLDTTKIKKEFGVSIRKWDAALAQNFK